jgi:hypothetical protein
MKENPQLRRAAVLLSGDTGLYSGAAQLRAALEEEAEPVRFRYLPGISSVAVLAATLQVTWEDAVILSTHGRERDVVGHLRRERKVFLLVSGLSGVHSTAELLKEAVANDVLPQEIRIGYGFNLSQDSAETGFVSLEQLESLDKRGLYILYLYIPTGTEMAIKEIYKMFPYVITLLVLIVVSLRKKREDQPPMSLGLPYFREER